MLSKKSTLILSNIIITVATLVLTLALNTILNQYIGNIYIQNIILLIFGISLYYFLSASVISTFLQTDEKLKDMIQHTLHELNTPIATIQANITLIKRSNVNEKSLQRLRRIEDATKNLTKLYESIEYNIQENIEDIPKEHISLNEIITQSILKFDDIKGDITIKNQIEDLQLYSDKNGFERVIDNLLSNALKYNKKSGHVLFYTQGSKLFIQDSGIGIEPKNLFIVYEKSFQENPTTLGYGLGLSIVKNFCDKEQITIKIDTRKDIGTTISLDLKNIIYK